MNNPNYEFTLEQEEFLKQLLTPLANTNLFKTVAKQSTTLPVLVVLDDDPTGTQTCHYINVLAVWDHNTLLEEFKSGSGGFFILTNSRDLPTLEARKLIATICHAVKEAARASNREFEIVLRATQLCVAISLMSQRLQKKFEVGPTLGFWRPSSGKVGDSRSTTYTTFRAQTANWSRLPRLRSRKMQPLATRIRISGTTWWRSQRGASQRIGCILYLLKTYALEVICA
jgi:hypothetical protein